MSRTLKRAIGIVAVVLAIGYVPQMVGCMQSHLPASGRIVDKDSRQGISDVTVLAVGMFEACGGLAEYRCTTTQEYRVVVKTDQDGSFQVPSELQRFSTERWIPWTLFLESVRSYRIVTAVKPGYVLSEDASSNPDMSTPSLRPRAALSRLEDLPMQPSTFPSSALYYAEIAGFGRSELNDRGEIALEESDPTYGPLREFVGLQVCAMPADALLDSKSARGISFFFGHGFVRANDPSAKATFLGALREVEPQDVTASDNYLMLNVKNLGFRAGDICGAVRKVREAR